MIGMPSFWILTSLSYTWDKGQMAEQRILGYYTGYRILKVERGLEAWKLNLKIRYCDTRSRSNCQKRHRHLMKENSFIVIFLAPGQINTHFYMNKELPGNGEEGEDDEQNVWVSNYTLELDWTPGILKKMVKDIM